MKKQIAMLIGLGWLAFTPVYAEGWSVVEALPTARARWMGVITNASGHELRLWREISRTKFQALAQLELKKSQFGNQPPQYRIDQGPWRDLDTPVETTAKLETERVTWTVWAGMTQDIGADDALYLWMQGNQITFRWTDKKGSTREETFSLLGANDTIRRVVSGTYK